MWVKSQQNLIGNKGRLHTKTYYPKQILNVDLGNSAYGKEFSYIHPCVVIYNEYSKVFVVPCSTKPARRNAKGDLFPENLEGLKTDGFAETTILLLNEARFIDKTRILDELGVVDNVLYDITYDKIFKLLFESKEFSLKKIQDILNKTVIDLVVANKEIARLESDVAKLEAAVAAHANET